MVHSPSSRQRLRSWRYYERERWHLSNFPSRRVRQRIRVWRASRAKGASGRLTQEN